MERQGSNIEGENRETGLMQANTDGLLAPSDEQPPRRTFAFVSTFAPLPPSASPMPLFRSRQMDLPGQLPWRSVSPLADRKTTIEGGADFRRRSERPNHLRTVGRVFRMVGSGRVSGCATIPMRWSIVNGLKGGETQLQESNPRRLF